MARFVSFKRIVVSLNFGHISCSACGFMCRIMRIVWVVWKFNEQITYEFVTHFSSGSACVVYEYRSCVYE